MQERIELGYKNLAEAVVEEAIRDWMRLVVVGKPSSSFKELRRFLRSTWCDDLLGLAEAQFTGPAILRILEARREAAEADPTLRAKYRQAYKRRYT